MGPRSRRAQIQAADATATAARPRRVGGGARPRSPRPGATRGRVATTALRAATLAATLAAMAFALALVWAPTPASALPNYIHDGITSCDTCHHSAPPSFFNCVECHPNSTVPNEKCTQCHAGKQTSGGKSCWQCHTPGAPQLPPTDANCQTCHGQMPHLGAAFGSSPGCTICHTTNPTPHHDGKTYNKPQVCTDCHNHANQQSHDKQPCTACHATDTHPNIPVVPDVCNRCHAAATFNGVGNCLQCHAGTQAFDGQTDNDIHDANIPDAPISASSCRSCHPDQQKHAGQVACLQCHPNADAFHHGTASSPGFKQCVDCHGQKPQHGSGLACTDCHGTNAMHQTQPTIPTSAVCNKCHSTATFGTRDCYRCHTKPIYHAIHGPGPCSNCHGSRGKHAGQVTCTQCHTNPMSGHHVSSVVIPSCQRTGCHTQQWHMGTVACTTCHGNAAHRTNPLSALPANHWAVCTECHSFASKVTRPCSDCHDSVQHSATYRVPQCQNCHSGKQLHGGKAPCTSCHTNLGPGHHLAGTIGHRQCNECHLDAKIHAVGTAAGAAFTCGTCHQGDIHGVLSLPTPGDCMKCHAVADLHAMGNVCWICHWPAVHNDKPNAAVYGKQVPLNTKLPPGTSGGGSSTTTTFPTTTTTEPGRSGLPYTGAQIGLMILGAVVLIGAGIFLRRKGRGDK